MNIFLILLYSYISHNYWPLLNANRYLMRFCISSSLRGSDIKFKTRQSVKIVFLVLVRTSINRLKPMLKLYKTINIINWWIFNVTDNVYVYRHHVNHILAYYKFKDIFLLLFTTRFGLECGKFFYYSYN